MKINSGAVDIEPQNPTSHYSIIETIKDRGIKAFILKEIDERLD